jgi:N-carbamoylputrescine amidase
MKKINAAILQGRWTGDFESNNTWYKTEALKLAHSDVNLIVLPELFHTPYFPVRESASAFDLAIEKDHPLIAEWRDIAKLLNCVIVFPFFEKRDRGIYHNSAFVFDKDGSIAGLYRKSHIPDDPGFYEKYYFIPGDTGLQPIQTSIGKLGVLICWDQWFPEAARLMSLRGADVLIYPTAIGWDADEPEIIYDRQKDSWMTVMRGHAIANRTFVIAANRVGTEEKLTFWGHSFAAAPDGYVLQENTADFSGTSRMEIDLDQTEENRRWWPHFRDRRVDLYGDILKIWGTP